MIPELTRASITNALIAQAIGRAEFTLRTGRRVLESGQIERTEKWPGVDQTPSPTPRPAAR